MSLPGEWHIRRSGTWALLMPPILQADPHLSATALQFTRNLTEIVKHVNVTRIELYFALRVWLKSS